MRSGVCAGPGARVVDEGASSGAGFEEGFSLRGADLEGLSSVYFVVMRVC
jgi:hypothetical protein